MARPAVLKATLGRGECWLRAGMTSSGDDMGKPRRRISVEEDELSVDHGGRLSVCICHIRFHACSSSQTHAKNAEMYILMDLTHLMWALSEIWRVCHLFRSDGGFAIGVGRERKGQTGDRTRDYPITRGTLCH